MKITKQFTLPILLALLFLMPFFAALWSYKSGVMKQAGLVNKGQLLSTSVTVPELISTQKWQLLYVSSATCEKVCLSDLDTLARVRLALGRRLYGLELSLGVKPPVELTAPVIHQLATMDIKVKNLKQIPQELRGSQVWIVNKEGKVIMTYTDSLQPKAIYADLKKLSELWAG